MSVPDLTGNVARATQVTVSGSTPTAIVAGWRWMLSKPGPFCTRWTTSPAWSSSIGWRAPRCLPP